MVCDGWDRENGNLKGMRGELSNEREGVESGCMVFGLGWIEWGDGEIMWWVFDGLFELM